MSASPTPPIPIDTTRTTPRFTTHCVEIAPEIIDRLRATGAEVHTDTATRVQSSRDWWPLAMTWAADSQIGAIAAAVVRPADVAQLSEVMAVCDSARIPVTTAGGRSGVTGGSIPLFGGIVLDTGAFAGIRWVDARAGIVDVGAGTFGTDLEDVLRRDHGLTVGHRPQSMALSTVGGWLACRGAGQLSNRYGKIEDIVVGLDAVLADGSVVELGGHARASGGPDLLGLLVGSEGTLGVITGARLRAMPAPTERWTGAWSFPSFAAGADACRRISRRGLEPAALRLYDAPEADRNWSTGDVAILLAIDEGDPEVLAATRAIVDQELAGATPADPGLPDRWWSHRNDVSALESLISKGYMVDTLELTASWSNLDDVYVAVRDSVAAIDGVLTCTAHLSHSYPDGACVYFTFAGAPASDELYLAVWEAGTRAALGLGASLSHHHGVGLNRGRFMADALGAGGTAMLAAV